MLKSGKTKTPFCVSVVGMRYINKCVHGGMGWKKRAKKFYMKQDLYIFA